MRDEGSHLRKRYRYKERGEKKEKKKKKNKKRGKGVRKKITENFILEKEVGKASDGDVINLEMTFPQKNKRL